MQKFAVVLVDRANYGRLKPVLEHMRDEPLIDLQLICTGSMLLDRFGRAVDIVRQDGFQVDESIYIELEGSTPTTMVKTMGLGLIELANTFERLKPDFVVVIGDRYEALSCAIAASFLNICLIHIQGGEITGSIDETTRHAITKMAHYHFPATQRSANYIHAMGERHDTIFALGCPSADVVKQSQTKTLQPSIDHLGVGAKIDWGQDYFVVLFHPVTTEYKSAEGQMEILLTALTQLNRQTVLIWPNIDAGSDGVSQAIRRFREFHPQFPLHAYKNFPPEQYIPLIQHAACLIGNSSSFVRDASFLGTPVVLIGSRQNGREISNAVLRVDVDKEQIVEATIKQLACKKHPPSNLYGRPGTSKQIVETMKSLVPYVQKQLCFEA